MMSVSLRRDWRFAAFTDWPLPMSEEARWGGGGVVCVGGGARRSRVAGAGRGAAWSDEEARRRPIRGATRRIERQEGTQVDDETLYPKPRNPKNRV